tara:strand:- start:270 stop:485 length:216 start_codon:yes stop_codon:yes gene_type:complete
MTEWTTAEKIEGVKEAIADSKAELAIPEFDGGSCHKIASQILAEAERQLKALKIDMEYEELFGDYTGVNHQ